MDKGTIIRSVVLTLVLVNQLLTAFGNCPLPLSDEEIQQGVSAIVTVIVALWAWFKNNYITKKGKRQREIIEKEGLD